MTDDLTTRLRTWADDAQFGAQKTLREAADRIEALEAERAALIEAALDHRATASRALGREKDARAVITAALVPHYAINTDTDGERCRECWKPWPCATFLALSRVPQGAAEPSDPQRADSGNAWGDDRPAEHVPAEGSDHA